MLNMDTMLAEQSVVLAVLPCLAERSAAFEDARATAPDLTHEGFETAVADLEWGRFVEDHGGILLLTGKGLRARRRLLASLEGRKMPGRDIPATLPIFPWGMPA